MCDVFWQQSAVHNRIIWLVVKWSESERGRKKETTLTYV